MLTLLSREESLDLFTAVLAQPKPCLLIKVRSNHNTSDHNPKAGFVIIQVAQKFFRKRVSFPLHRRGVKVHIPWTVSNGNLYPTNYLTAHTFAQYFS